MEISGLVRINRLTLSSLEDGAITQAFHAQRNIDAPYASKRDGVAIITTNDSIVVGASFDNHVFSTPYAGMRACIAMQEAEGKLRFHTLICVMDELHIPCSLCFRNMQRWALTDTSKVKVILVSTKNPYTVFQCTLEEVLKTSNEFCLEHLA
ncbi:MAG: hypothetical protein WCW78_02555 [Candidatus Paceibacterota bacterium]|jgi:cytidine deaminase